jgi:spermidine synthase
VHSILPARGYLTADYWDSFLVLPFAASEQPPERIAILGNAAGTIARQYGRFWPDTEVDGVEIDAELSDVGYRYFDMGSNPRLTIHSDDARPWLRRATDEYDLIVVDAYRQPYIPFYLTTEEFFELIADRLTPDGVVVVNVGHPEGDDEFERSLGRTMAAVLPSVLRDPAEQTNTLLIGGSGPLSAERLAAAAQEQMKGNLRKLAEIDAARMGPILPGGTVFTDDRAPVEWLVDRAIIGAAEDR